MQIGQITRFTGAVALFSLGLVACGDQLEVPTGVVTEAAKAPPAGKGGGNGGGGGDGGGSTTSDVPSDWTIFNPAADGTAGLYHDGRFSTSTDHGDGSVYANGVCGISSLIQVENGSYGSSVDITRPKGSDKTCVGGARGLTVRFPDGDVQDIGIGGRLRVGTLHPDHPSLNDDDPSTVAPGYGVVRILGTARCEAVIFGQGKAGNGLEGQELTVVELVDGQKWYLHTGEDGNTGYCHNPGAANDGEEFPGMHVAFIIEAEGPVEALTG